MINKEQIAMDNALQESERQLSEVRRQFPITLEEKIRSVASVAARLPKETRDAMVQDIIDRIHVAIIAAVYAGHIESADAMAKFNGIGADSYQHREEYMNYAANFDFPWAEDGKIASDVTFDVVSDYMWDTYGPDKEEK